MFIDALDYNYPLTESTIDIVMSNLELCTVRIFGLIQSNYLLGSVWILILLDRIHRKGCKIKQFDTRETGEFWINRLINLQLARYPR